MKRKYDKVLQADIEKSIELRAELDGAIITDVNFNTLLDKATFTLLDARTGRIKSLIATLGAGNTLKVYVKEQK